MPRAPPADMLRRPFEEASAADEEVIDVRDRRGATPAALSRARWTALLHPVPVACCVHMCSDASPCRSHPPAGLLRWTLLERETTF